LFLTVSQSKIDFSDLRLAITIL